MDDAYPAPATYRFKWNGQVPDLAILPDTFAPFLTSVRRYLHARPEIGYQEKETHQFIRRHLEMAGLTVVGPLAKTGLYVDIVGGHPGPKIGYRSDMDALPIQDGKSVPYRSQHDGVAHLCGHDAHMTVALGVALLLQHLRDQIHGSVRVFFQPNEEGTPSGSVPMIKAGVLEGLEAVYCIHADPTLDVGVYGLITGPVTASSDRLRACIRAKRTGHSARPHQAKDTIWIANLLLNQFYQYIGRITDARNGAVLTVCMFKGGITHNVIPSEVTFEGTLRCLNRDDRTNLKALMRQTAEQLAALHGVSIDLEFTSSMSSVLNDQRLVQNVRNTIEQLFGPEASFDIPVPSMGSEDFAHYLEYLPGMLARVGTASGIWSRLPLHDNQFDLDDACLQPAVRLMSQALMNHLRLGILQERA